MQVPTPPRTVQITNHPTDSNGLFFYSVLDYYYSFLIQMVSLFLYYLGHLIFKLGDNLTPRYKIMSLLGEGTFGKVLQCWDRTRQALVAVKVVRAIKKYTEAARIEIRILEDIKRRDPDDNRFILHYLLIFTLFVFLFFYSPIDEFIFLFSYLFLNSLYFVHSYLSTVFIVWSLLSVLILEENYVLFSKSLGWVCLTVSEKTASVGSVSHLSAHLHSSCWLLFIVCIHSLSSLFTIL